VWVGSSQPVPDPAELLSDFPFYCAILFLRLFREYSTLVKMNELHRMYPTRGHRLLCTLNQTMGLFTDMHCACLCKLVMPQRQVLQRHPDTQQPCIVSAEAEPKPQQLSLTTFGSKTNQHTSILMPKSYNQCCPSSMCRATVKVCKMHTLTQTYTSHPYKTF